MDDLSLPRQRRDNLFPAGMKSFYLKQKTLLEWIKSPEGKTQTTAPKRPGKMSAIFMPNVLRPFPTPLATPFRPLEGELRITPRVVPTASKTAVTVKPYFWNMDFTFSLRRSLSGSCSISPSPLFSISFFSFSSSLLFSLARSLSTEGLF